MTTDFLCDFVVEHDVIGILMNDENGHIELIRRLPVLLKLLFAKRKLTQSHLESLCRLVVTGKHESTEHIIFAILVEMSNYLPFEDLELVFSHIEKKSIAEYDIHAVRFLRNFSASAFKTASGYYRTKAGKEREKNGLKNFFGLPLLFRLYVESESTNSTDEQLLKESLDSMLALLKLDYASEERALFIEECLKRIESRGQTSFQLCLLENLLKTYSPAPKAWSAFSSNSLSKAIENLNESKAILEVILDELAEFMRNSSKKLETAGSHYDSEKPSKDHGIKSFVLPVTKLSHLQHIRLRLDLLYFLLTNSSLFLSNTQFSSLWNVLVTECSTREEQGVFFSWLLKSKLHGDKTAFKDNAVLTSDQLSFSFESCLKMNSSEFSELGESFFDFWYKRFLETHKGGCIRKTQVFRRSEFFVEFEVLDYDGITSALDFLWSLFVNCSNIKVVRKVALLLNRIHLRLSTKSSVDEIQQNYVSRILKSLLDKESSGCISPETIQSRFIFLLKSFLKAFSVTEELREAVVRLVSDPEFCSETLRLRINGTTRVHEIRTRAIEHLQLRNSGLIQEQILLFYGDEKTPLLNDSSILAKVTAVRSGDQITVRRAPSSFPRLGKGNLTLGKTSCSYEDPLDVNEDVEEVVHRHPFNVINSFLPVLTVPRRSYFPKSWKRSLQARKSSLNYMIRYLHLTPAWHLMYGQFYRSFLLPLNL